MVNGVCRSCKEQDDCPLFLQDLVDEAGDCDSFAPKKSARPYIRKSDVCWRCLKFDSCVDINRIGCNEFQRDPAIVSE
jgi:hypothetical protein